MNLFYPDLNVWMALSVSRHAHSAQAWSWLSSVASDQRILLSRYTQLGILRLLTNSAVMGDKTRTLQEAWAVYDGWLSDPRVEFHAEPRDTDSAFRLTTHPFGAMQATKWVGDCWLLAFAQASGASLVTFDQALHAQARKIGNKAVIPS